MAGRGTDIRLGQGVAERGGLHVILTEYHDSRRVDRQFFGRCARQGDPGSCEAIVSLEDEIYAVYAPTATGLVSGLRWFGARRPVTLHHYLRTIAQFAAERRGAQLRVQNLKLDRQTNLVPIIMVTCRDQPQDRIHGLQVGANHYLTKPFTPDQLERAIQEVSAWKEELIRHGTRGEIHFHMKSDTQSLEELNFLLGALFLHSGMPQGLVKQLTMAVREMGTNAIESGHQKQIDRIVMVTYRIDSEKITIIVRDTGPGFNPSDLPHAAKPGDPIGHLEVREKMGLREGGFGIMIARGLVDELQYNEKGNEVRLVKFFPPKPKVEDRG